MRFKKILIIFFSLLLFMAAGIFVIGKYYNNEVKDFVFKRINERLTAPLSVGDMELTLFADFPQASLRFTNVTIADKLSRNQSDTLLYAEKLFLSFNFWDIWNKNYKITKVKVEGGMFHLAYDKKGNSNLEIWKKDEKASDNSDFKLDLNSVELENLFFRLSQPANRQYLRCFIKNSELSGNFSSSQYNLETALNARVYNYSINGVNYITHKDLALETTLNINNDKSTIEFREVALGINTINLAIDGIINYGKRPMLDLNIRGKQISVIELMASLPEFSRESIKNYETEGTLSLKSRLWGSLEHGDLPRFTADFNIDKASLTEKTSNITLSNLDLEGSYSSSFTGFDDSLRFDHLSGNFSLGQFAVSGSVFNFKNPDIKAMVQGNVDLEQLYHFFRWEGADTLAGKLAINASIVGKLDQTDTASAQVINKLNTNGTVSLKDGRFKLRDARQTLQKVSGEVTLEGNLAMVKNLSLHTANCDFKIDGIINNLLPYIFRKDQEMMVEASLRSSKIDLSDFIEEKASSKDRQDLRVAFPPGVKGNLTANIGKLLYRKFSAEQISGRFKLAPTGLAAEGLDLKAFNGRVQGSVYLERQADHYNLNNQTTLTNVELDKVFLQFENFGQDIITNKEVKGKTDASVAVNARLNNQLQVDASSLVSTIQLKIRDGELNNLQVLQDLAGYLRSNVAINAVVNCTKLADRLKKVSFSTLENTITIKDKKITIPEMAIKSSALDINVNGTHTFDNHIDYGLNFRMAQIFKKDVVTEYGYIVDDNTGMRMFIAIGGTTDDPQFKYDKLSASQARKEKFQQEKATFKSILKQELGLFKNDTTVKAAPATGKAPVKFELEYENKKKPTPSASQPIPTATTPSKQKEAAKATTDKDKKKKAKKEYDEKDYNLDGDL